jgi:transcriptional regulator with XRE-family HTH domain
MFTPAQCRGARGILDWTQERLATQASVSLSTIKEFEAGRRTPIANNLAAIQRAIEAAGVEFIDGDSPGVRMRLGAKPSAYRKVASTKKTKPLAKPRRRAKASKT